MLTQRRRSPTSDRPTRSVLGACVVALALTAPGGPSRADAQELPFTVTIIDWDRMTLERQRRAFRSEAEEHEVLFCVESWTTTPIQTGVERVVITAVRRELGGQKNHIRDVGERCIGKDGRRLPMFHTHSDGNCQFSPNDLVTLVARGALFEGVQCGERHFVWAFAWQVAALAATIELGGLSFRRAPVLTTDPARPPPPPR